MDRLRTTWDRVRRQVLLHRRFLAAVFAAATVWAVIHAVEARSATAEGVDVWVAAHDLAAGTVLEASDLRRGELPAGSVPSGGITSPRDAVGRALAAPLPSGMPITEPQLVRPGMLRGYPGRVALGVRIPDPDTVAMLRPGDRIALLGADPQGRIEATQVTTDAIVVTVPDATSDNVAGVSTGRLVVLAVRPSEAAMVSTAAASQFLSILWTN